MNSPILLITCVKLLLTLWKQPLNTSQVNSTLEKSLSDGCVLSQSLRGGIYLQSANHCQRQPCSLVFTVHQDPGSQLYLCNCVCVIFDISDGVIPCTYQWQNPHTLIKQTSGTRVWSVLAPFQPKEDLPKLECLRVECKQRVNYKLERFFLPKH